MTRPLQSMSFQRQPLDAILAGPGSVRVLRALLAHGGALSVARLAADTRLTAEGVRGVLAELARCGVAEAIGQGRVRLFRAVTGHPMTAALDALFVAERARFDAMVSAITQCAADSRIAALWLFGSVSRGQDRPDSDLDLAAVIAADAAEVDRITDALRDLLAVQQQQFAFSASVVALSLDDVRCHAQQQTPLWDGLMRDARPLKGLAPGRLIGGLPRMEAGAAA